MKKVILAFDSFKGSVPSTEIAECARKAILQEFPSCKVATFPIADGGEGTTEALRAGLQAETVRCRVHDARMNRIEVEYVVTADKQTAILEMAAASGLPLIDEALRNPMHTSTYGTGEMILDALQRGCRRFIMGIGGSATNDAGIGMLAALGVRFTDTEGRVVEPVGRNLIHIAHVDASRLPDALHEATFTIACDVNNPFCGPYGAACIFAPQKGASPQEVEMLDRGLEHYAEILGKEMGMDVRTIPGAGAAGGLGGGLLPFLNATLQSGIDTILDILHFEDALCDASLVLTGEGKVDRQTGMGKALGGILQRARRASVPVVAIGGAVEATEQLNHMGFTAVFPIQPGPVSLSEAMQWEFTLGNIERTVAQIVRLASQFEKG